MGDQQIDGGRRLFNIANSVVILAVILYLGVMTAVMITNQRQIAALTQRQIAFVQHQNDAQLCAQAAILRGVRSIARSLGLPTTGIVVPDVSGLECEA